MLNGSKIANGLITRKRVTKNKIKESVIDLLIVTSELIDEVKEMIVYENRENVLKRTIAKKNGNIIKESDHNNILTTFNLKIKPQKKERIEMFNFKNRHAQKKFKSYTSGTLMLSSVFNSNDNLDIQTKRFLKKLDGSIAKCFNKVRVNNKAMI